MPVGAASPHFLPKTTPPRAPRTVLERPRLSSTRPEFADKSVIALQAAAGYGKTSLLAQWRREALQTGAAVAWLTLDSQGNDSRLVLGLAAAMRVATGRPDVGQACLLAAGLDDGSLEAMTEWLAEVADLRIILSNWVRPGPCSRRASPNCPSPTSASAACARRHICAGRRASVAAPVHREPRRAHAPAHIARSQRRLCRRGAESRRIPREPRGSRVGAARAGRGTPAPRA